MGTALRRLRRRVLTPDVSETLLDKRGFHRKNASAQELLETVGATFLAGYGNAAESATAAQTHESLAGIAPRFRGFAYEGAGMGLAVLDGLPFGHRHHAADLLAGQGEPHTYLVYVGMGWAMARLPRPCWPDPAGLDPLLSWLLLDGYGFHQAYFRTRTYVRGTYQNPSFPWPDKKNAAYANRVIDQGIGRALWFVCGTAVDLVAETVNTFAAHRHGDLYAGIGLAAAYAGGVDADELHALVRHAGAHRAQLAQGAAFAAEARQRPGLMAEHTELATTILCGTDARTAAEVTQRTRPCADEARRDGAAAYEAWRVRIGSDVLSGKGAVT